MEKILLALDPTQPDTGSLDFASYLGALTKSRITGVFLGSPEADDKLSARQLVYDKADSSLQQDQGSKEYQVKQLRLRENVKLFTQACERRSTRYCVRMASGDPVKEIVRESRFSDIVVVNAETSFGGKFGGTPTPFVRDILKDVECPVIIAPESFEGIEEIVFTYDGTKSAMFAIKQFCYLFPKLNDKKVVLLQVIDDSMPAAEDREHLREWLSSHYSAVGFETLRGDSKTELLAWLMKKQNVFIVMGAYSKKGLAQFVHESHADWLLQILNRAFFIAHY